MSEDRVSVAVAACLALAAIAHPGVAMAAAAQVGEADLVVSMVRGTVGQITRELAIKDDVYTEEVVETTADAATRIVFLDGTELSMGPSSRMVLDRYVYDPNAGTGELVMRTVSGVFEFASGSIPAEGYDLRTPFGNLAVRGTRLRLVVSPGAQGVVEVTEGSVESQGTTIGPEDGCLLMPLPGTGTARVLEESECADLLEPVTVMLAMLGVPDVAPAAGPDVLSPDLGGDNDPPLSPGPGASPD